MILKNKTGIESWIVKKAEHRREHFNMTEKFLYPYDLGRKENLRQVFNWSGDMRPIGDGFSWNVADGCDQFTLTLEQLAQKEDKRVHAVRYIVTRDYSGSIFPCGLGCKVVCCVPWLEESRIAIREKEVLLVTRWQKHWFYGEKLVEDLVMQEEGKIEKVGEKSEKLTSVPIKGWFPGKCVRILETSRARKQKQQAKEDDNEQVKDRSVEMKKKKKVN